MINYALTTKERVKSRLDITATTFDGLFNALISAVTARIEKMTCRRFKQTAYSQELYDGSDIYGTTLKVLVANNGPMTALPILEYKAGSNTDPTWYTYSENDYDVNLDLAAIYMNGTLPPGKRNVRLTYTAGYVIDFTSSYDVGVTHTLPFEITEVCEEVVIRLFKKRDSEGRSNESFQESSITWDKDVFTPENIATIRNYRRII